MQGEAAAGVVMLRPASPGTGVIAGGAVRAVLECAGVHDILSKSLGSDNAINVVHATVAALKLLQRPEEVAARRGLPIEDVAPAGMLRAASRASTRWPRRRHVKATSRGPRQSSQERRQLKITQVRSTIGCPLEAARKPAHTGPAARSASRWIREDNAADPRPDPTVRHLVEVEAVEADMSEIIKLHDLQPAPGAKTAKTRVGRGEGSKGKTAGRGTKGTKARKNVPATFEGGQMPIHMRLPKLKGFRNRFRTEYEVVNVGDLNRLFPKGGEIGVDELVATGAVAQEAGQGARRRQADGQGDVTAHKFSGERREKITAAGGSATEL